MVSLELTLPKWCLLHRMTGGHRGHVPCPNARVVKRILRLTPALDCDEAVYQQHSWNFQYEYVQLPKILL